MTRLRSRNEGRLARNTAVSDFRIADLMNGDAPASLYLVVPPSDLVRTRPIIRLMLNQIGRRLTESMQVGGKTAYKHRLLLLLDEFPSLGKLEFFETALTFIAGYGLKAFLIAQSLNQLEKAYGPPKGGVELGPTRRKGEKHRRCPHRSSRAELGARLCLPRRPPPPASQTSYATSPHALRHRGGQGCGGERNQDRHCPRYKVPGRAREGDSGVVAPPIPPRSLPRAALAYVD